MKNEIKKKFSVHSLRWRGFFFNITATIIVKNKKYFQTSFHISFLFSQYFCQQIQCIQQTHTADRQTKIQGVNGNEWQPINRISRERDEGKEKYRKYCSRQTKRWTNIKSNILKICIFTHNGQWFRSFKSILCICK